MWLWIVVGLVCMVALVIGVLCIPVHAVIDADTAAERKFTFRLTWLFGLVEVGIPAGRGRGGAIRPRLPNWQRLLRSRKALGELRKIAGDLFARIKIREVTVQVRFSTGSIVEAGILTGLVFALKPLLRVPQEYTIDIQPDFSTEAFFEGRAHFDASARPIGLVGPMVRAWRVARRGGKL